MSRFAAILIALIVTASLANAQNYNADHEKLHALLDTVDKMQEQGRFNEIESFIPEIKQALTPKTETGLRRHYYFTLGYYYFETRQIPKALEHLKKAEVLVNHDADSNTLSAIYSALGNVYAVIGDGEKALGYFDKAASHTKPSESVRLNGILLNKSNVLVQLNRYDEALHNLQKAKENFRQTENFKYLGLVENNIGELYRERLEDFDKAKQHYYKAITANKKAESRAGLSQNYHNLANAHLPSSVDSALHYAQKTLELRKELGDLGGLTSALHLMGSVYHRMENLEEAEKYYLESLEQSKNYGLTQGIYFNSTGLTKIYISRGNFDKALQYLKEAQAISDQMGDLELSIETCELFYLYYKDQGLFKQALTQLEGCDELSDSLQNILSDGALTEARALYESDLTEQENEFLKQKGLIAQNEMKSQRIFLFVVIGITILLVLLSVRLLRILRQRNAALREVNDSKAAIQKQYQKEKEQQEELRQANDLKNKILSVLGHDLRSPLASISGILSSVTASAVSQDELHNFFTLLKKETDLSLKTLQEILTWARMQMDELNLKYQEIIPHQIMSDVLSLYETSIRSKNIKVKYNSESGVKIWADLNQLRSIMGNLLSNAIKFSPQDSEVEINFSENEKNTIIEIRDHGHGISDEVLKNLNSRKTLISNQGTKGESGVGVGLRIVQDFVDAHQGTMQFAQAEGGGTSVQVTLPKKSITTNG